MINLSDYKLTKIFLLALFCCPHVLTQVSYPSYTDFAKQYYLRKIKAPDAWNITIGSTNVIIGVIDSGIPLSGSNLSHPNLNNSSKIIKGTSYVGSNVGDDNGHGTFVAGLIGAEVNNGVGINGVCYNAKIYVVKVSDALANQNSRDVIAQAIISAVNYGCKIINICLGHKSDPPNIIPPDVDPPGILVMPPYNGGPRIGGGPLESAVQCAQERGVLIVACAGNDADTVLYPARYAISYNNVIAVSATDSNDVFAYTMSGSAGSNYGPEITVSAPGKDIYSTYIYSVYYPTGYHTGDGTSASTPIVSGVAGLIWSKFPHLTAAQVRRQIELSADDLGTPGHDIYYGYGRVNAYNAVRYLYVPQIYPTIQNALNYATAGQTILVTGTQNINTPITIPSCVTLVMHPGANVTFAGGLVVNGNLETNGATLNFAYNTSLIINSGATFTSTTSMTIPAGVTFEIQSGATVNFSGNLTVNGTFQSNVATLNFNYLPNGNPAGLITNGMAYFQGTSFNTSVPGKWAGIAVNDYASFINCIISNCNIGITSYNGEAYISGTTFSNVSIGLNCINFLSFVRKSNFYSSSYDIKGDANAYIAGSGNNNFYGASWKLYSLYPSTPYTTIEAQSNYWGGGAPSVGTQVTSNVDYSKYSNSPFFKQDILEEEHKANIEGIFFKQNVFNNDKSVEGVPGIEELNKAILLIINEKYGEALVEMQRLMDEYKDGFVGKRALVYIELILRKTEREKEILPMLKSYSVGKSKVAQFAEYRKTYQHLRLQEYDKAIAIMKDTKFSEEDANLKQARLYDLGVIYHDFIGDKAEAYNYFSELVNTYPDCPLAEVTNIFYKITKDGYVKPPTTKDETTEEDEIAVTDTKIFANYPNPFNPSTIIKYQLGEASQVSLKVYDMLGREVTTLVNSFQNKGSYDVTFNANGLSSGIYFYKLNANGKQLINKMLLMK